MDKIDALKNQKEYEKTFAKIGKGYFDADKITSSERADLTKTQIIALQGELFELAEATNLLPWKPGVSSIDHIHEELVDTYHFFLNLCLLWNITSEDELRNKYLAKNKENYRRGWMHMKPTEGFKFDKDA